MNKKTLISYVLMLLIAFSCSNNESEYEQEELIAPAIDFMIYSSKTKGKPIIGNEDFKLVNSGFGVTAFISSEQNLPYVGNITEGAQIVYTTNWQYKKDAEIRYWPPQTMTLDFYAYAPFLDTKRVNPSFSKTTGMVFKDYMISPKEEDQQDLMYAVALKKNKESDAGKVPLLFKHALTQIHFNARVEGNNMCVDIASNGIKLHNINSKGTFSVNNTIVKWEPASSKVLQEYTVSSQEKTINHGTQYQTISQTDKALMLMPQEFVAWNTKSSVKGQQGGYLSINCKIYTQDAQKQKVFLHGSKDSYALLYVPFSSMNVRNSDEQLWKMGKKITYNLLFGGGYNENGKPILTPITFTTTVESWIDQTGYLDI